MSTGIHDVLHSFDNLPDGEKRVAAAEILRRMADWDYPPIEDEDLARLANELFVELDREESAHEQS
jgi:hypothetical protein